MKKPFILIIIFAFTLILLSCGQNKSNEDYKKKELELKQKELELRERELNLKENESSDVTDENGETTQIFESDDFGYLEYMKRVEKKNGEFTWYYYTKDNTMDIELGLNELNSIFDEPAVYFKNKPKIIYQIERKDCGFSLFVLSPKGKRENEQFYKQVNPVCN